MQLTAAQQATLKSDIAANVNTIPPGQLWTLRFAGTPINQIPTGNDFDGATAVAGWYSQNAVSGFLVFNSAVPNQQVFNQVLFASYTPADAISSGNAAIWTAWSMACQGKQFNLQNMLQPGGTFNASLVNYRKGLKDAMTNLPSGNAGALQDGGWNASLNTSPNVLTRVASNVEVLFAVASTGPLAAGSAGLGTGGLQGVSNIAAAVVDSQIQGGLNAQDILNLWTS